MKNAALLLGGLLAAVALWALWNRFKPAGNPPSSSPSAPSSSTSAPSSSPSPSASCSASDVDWEVMISNADNCTIKYLQKVLNKSASPKLSEDGIFGPKTEAAFDDAMKPTLGAKFHNLKDVVLKVAPELYGQQHNSSTGNGGVSTTTVEIPDDPSWWASAFTSATFPGLQTVWGYVNPF